MPDADVPDAAVPDEPDPFDLARFVAAQDAGGIHQQALAELRAGCKTGHWIWFVFPQLVGLGRSATSRRYALSGLAEARAYLSHPVLGPRLRAATTVLTDLGDTSADRVFGSLDATKLRSSMTLFARADPDEQLFPAVLRQWFDEVEDPETTARV